MKSKEKISEKLINEFTKWKMDVNFGVDFDKSCKFLEEFAIKSLYVEVLTNSMFPNLSSEFLSKLYLKVQSDKSPLESLYSIWCKLHKEYRYKTFEKTLNVYVKGEKNENEF